MDASNIANMVAPQCDLVDTVSQFHKNEFLQNLFLKYFSGCLTD